MTRVQKGLTSLIATFVMLLGITYVQISPSFAYAGTLENGNMAYAQSSFNTGEACNYLPGFETGYDAWHFVLTTRGATFMQSSTNALVSTNLNFIFMRPDGSTFTIQSGAWVQTGKGAYVYTLVSEKDRMVQAGSLAKINGLDSGMRLSHTCPGSGSPTNLTNSTPTPTPTNTTSTPSPSPTTTTASPTPTPTNTTVSPSPTPTTSPSPSSKYQGTLENGDGAPADSEFDKGEACIYLPGYETGYDAWHFVLTTRGSTFVQDPYDLKKASELHMTFTRSDGSKYVITSGAWVQTGKGSYVYTPVSEKARMVQGETYATTLNSSSGMRLSHTCPGEGDVIEEEIPEPTPEPTIIETPAPKLSPTPCPCNFSILKVKKLLPTPTPTKQPILPGEPPTNEPTPTPTNEELPPPELPTPPPVEDPEEIIYVDPDGPTDLPPSLFPTPPSGPVLITEPPKYGEIKENPNGTFTYIPNPPTTNNPVVDSVTFTYTDLSGKIVVVRKQFIASQQGDVPSIIQTGSTRYPGGTLPIIFIISLLVMGAVISFSKESANEN